MISTHILDISTGFPASGVQVRLDRDTGGGNWQTLQKDLTNADGRIAFQCPFEVGTYRLTFGVEAYLQSKGLIPFFLDVPIVFRVTDTGRKYHVPLLLSPYGLSTYRGS